MFEDRPETFNNEFINKDNNKSLKEGIQKYVKGELAEAELNNVLKENNINPDLNSVKRKFLLVFFLKKNLKTFFNIFSLKGK